MEVIIIFIHYGDMECWPWL